MTKLVDIDLIHLYQELNVSGDIPCIDLEEHDAKIREDVIEEYKNLLLSRLIPHLNDLPSAKNCETYLAITEIAEQIKKNESN